jgi:hypothetical protein
LLVSILFVRYYIHVPRKYIKKNRLCSVKGCSRSHSSKGFCRAHYIRHRRGGDPHKGFGIEKKESHGMCGTPTYVTWSNVKTRCFNPNAIGYGHYGGRGIKMCKRWRGSFTNFLEDMGERPIGKELDRKDNDGDYDPGNCRWVTHSENSRNTRGIRCIDFDGQSLCVSEWAEKLGIAKEVIYTRLSRGWTEERSLTQPVRC